MFNLIRLSKIKIKEEFKEHQPKYFKMMDRMNYYLATNKFAVPIVINKNNTLVDGYTSYLIAKKVNKKFVKVVRV